MPGCPARRLCKGLVFLDHRRWETPSHIQLVLPRPQASKYMTLAYFPEVVQHQQHNDTNSTSRTQHTWRAACSLRPISRTAPQQRQLKKPRRSLKPVGNSLNPPFRAPCRELCLTWTPRHLNPQLRPCSLSRTPANMPPRARSRPPKNGGLRWGRQEVDKGGVGRRRLRVGESCRTVASMLWIAELWFAGRVSVRERCWGRDEEWKARWKCEKRWTRKW